jgi:tetratricopeptide (TPR) repeat protein
MHYMHGTPLLMPGDVYKGAGEKMDDKVTYRQQVNFCGKPGCRKCQQGIGHGPYWYSYQVVDGRSVRTYIGKNLPPGVQVPTSQKTPAIAENPDALRLGDMRHASQSLSSEIDELDRLLALDPTNEEAVRRLMMALLRARRRGEALRVYQRLASVLRDGYRKEPSVETRVVYEAVLRGEEVARGDEERPTRDGGEVTRIQRGVQIGRSNQSPLVGREHELRILQQLLISTEEFRRSRAGDQQKAAGIAAVTLETQHPQCMVLMGEAGIGKTRLAEETAREGQQRGWAVVWSYVYAQESGIPYRLWIEALRRMIIQGLWQGQDVAQRPYIFEPLEALLPEMRELLEWDGNDEQTAGGDTGREGGRDKSGPYLWEAVYELLATISARTPLMIVLDDVQWADASSCELLGYLARRLHSHPIVLLMTCREKELPSKHPLRSLLAHMQREHAVETLHVQPLTDDQVGTLVAYLPQNMVQHIQKQAAGNPFFAEELAYSIGVDDAGLPATRAEVKQSPREALPGTITAALDQRLSKLSSACQQLLSKAAVLGGSFGFQLISAMEAGSASGDEDVLFDLLEEALRSGVLTEEGTGPRIIYHFWHPLLAGHLYKQLSSTRRARLHRRAAEVLQQVYATREGEHAATITRHLVEGGAAAVQIARFAELAGNHAYGLSAYPEAERHYRLAVEQVENVDTGEPYQDQERLHLAFILERLAECTRIQGNFKEARNLFERELEVRNVSRAFNAAEEAQQEAQIQALLWSEIGWTWRFTGDTARTQQCCEHGEQVLREAGILRGPAWARLRFQQSSIHWQQGNYEDAFRAAQQALSLFEESIPPAPIRLTRVYPEPFVPQGKLRERAAAQLPYGSGETIGEGDASELLKGDMPDTSNLTRIRRTLLGDPVDLGRTHALLGAIASAIGQRNEALQHQNRALAIYERYDRQREIAHVSNNIGYLHLKKAEYTLAQSFLQRSFSLAERIGDVPLMSVVFHNLGELAAASGDLQEAESLYKKSLLLAEQVEDREYVSLWNADLASVLLTKGDLVEAEVCVGRALSTGRAIRNAPCLGLALVVLGNLRIAQARARADAETRNLVRARGSLRRALALQGLEVETRVRGQLALAEVSLLMGQREAAQGEAVRAMEEARRFELVAVLKDCERLLRGIEGKE